MAAHFDVTDVEVDTAGGLRRQEAAVAAVDQRLALLGDPLHDLHAQRSFPRSSQGVPVVIPGGARTSPAWRLLRGVLGLLTIVAVIVALVFIFLAARTEGTANTLADIFFLGVPATYATVGMLLCVRRPENTVGWLCLSIGFLWAVAAATDAVTGWGAAQGRVGVADWTGLSDALWLPAVGLTCLLVLTFPDGRLLSERWRWFAWFCAGSVVLVTVLLATVPGRVSDLPGTENPIGSPWLQHLSPLFVLIPVSFVGAVTSLILRYRRSDGLARLQIRWIAFGGLVLSRSASPRWLRPCWGSFDGSLPAGGAGRRHDRQLAIPITIGVAVLRYRLYEIDTIINRALVYAALTATLAVTYLGWSGSSSSRSDRSPTSPAWPSRPRRSRWRRCSARRAPASRTRSTAGSTDASTTPPAPSTRSVRACARRWTCRPSAATCARWSRRPCSRRTSLCGCGLRRTRASGGPPAWRPGWWRRCRRTSGARPPGR